MPLNVGDKAPDFVAVTDNGDNFKLSDNLGNWIVLYFYPKDNTPGCTKEACSFRDNMERITSYNAKVYGVSFDSTNSHTNFKETHSLNFSLLSDPDKQIATKYDVFGEKSMFGKTVLGLKRSTFIIDPEGIIRWAKRSVKVDGHVDEVISKLQQLQSK
jgi:peroxiredoxin Q/BCP